MKFVYLLLIGIFFFACTNDDANINLHQTQSQAHISLLLRASSSGINQDTQTWEDRVDEVRMLAFAQNGTIVYNAKLNFPNGFNSRSEAVQFTPGVYDFYFIANESAFTSDFSAALRAITDRSQFQTDQSFNQLKYNPDFKPDATSGSGRFLMSAIYEDVNVVEGGTQENPNPLILPTGRVELVRSLAKVEVIFRKKTSGGQVPANIIASVGLQKVAQNFSVPAQDVVYAGTTTQSNQIIPAGFNYNNDSIGAVVFYVPELLRQTNEYTELHINDQTFPVQSDAELSGLSAQRRTISGLSAYSLIRNYHYQINAYINSQGGIQLKVHVNPWNKANYVYMFQDPDQTIVIPPVMPTDSSVIVPTACGKIEIRSNNEYLQNGLQGAYGDMINWWDPAVQGPAIIKGQAPYYCEKKYGKGWRLMNSCEMMSFLALFDQTYKIWQSNTWRGINSNLPAYSVQFRQQAQELLGKLSGVDMSKFIITDVYGGDNFGSEKLGIIDDYFTPGDIVVTLKDYPGGWPFPSPSFPGIENWFPMEVVHQVKGYWYSGYLDYSDPANYDKVLYQQFQRYNFSSTVCRCVRDVE